MKKSPKTGYETKRMYVLVGLFLLATFGSLYAYNANTKDMQSFFTNGVSKFLLATTGTNNNSATRCQFKYRKNTVLFQQNSNSSNINYGFDNAIAPELTSSSGCTYSNFRFVGSQLPSGVSIDSATGRVYSTYSQADSWAAPSPSVSLLQREDRIYERVNLSAKQITVSAMVSGQARLTNFWLLTSSVPRVQNPIGNYRLLYGQNGISLPNQSVTFSRGSRHSISPLAFNASAANAWDRGTPPLQYFTNNTVSYGSNATQRYVVFPSLPGSLSLNNATGQISGTVNRDATVGCNDYGIYRLAQGNNRVNQTPTDLIQQGQVNICVN